MSNSKPCLKEYNSMRQVHKFKFSRALIGFTRNFAANLTENHTSIHYNLTISTSNYMLCIVSQI